MTKSLLAALGLAFAFAVAVSMPIIGVDIANAATKQAPAATTATTTKPASDAMATKHVKKHKKHVKKHTKHTKKHTMAKKAY
ncbi:hypothetical protein BPNPMPFG_002426 [Mesorhizobium sp. AR07]|uniref:hypothetical protein n=1 Tax=Mesorhizobium sp. AR07 TaxID=2865838 RepID=UPI00215E0AD5|nr:hypothetical protein [Mesorhizobium sp. AR07]UVK46722.1 hypothetical protein BPNPMPFG_002426 [Mesorhizobium sp. AR07]